MSLKTKKEWAEKLRELNLAWFQSVLENPTARAELADYLDPPAHPDVWPDNGEIVILGNGGMGIADDRTPYDYRTMDGKPADLGNGTIQAMLGDNAIVRLATDSDVKRFCVRGVYKGAILGNPCAVPIIREWAMIKFGDPTVAVDAVETEERYKRILGFFNTIRDLAKKGLRP